MTRPLVLAALALAVLGCGLPPAASTSAPAAASTSALTAAPADDPVAPPTAGATWQVRPADLDGQARAAFEWSLDPGARSSDTVIVTNLGTEPLSLSLSSADIVTTPSGDLTLGADDAAPVARDWVSLAADEVTLQPSEATEVPFDIAPPANAEPGDYAVAVLASLARPVTGDEGQAAVLDTRVGARLYLRVLGDLRSELTVSDLTVGRDAEWWNPLPATATSDFVVTNEGNIRLDATAVVTLTGPFGWELGRTQVRKLPQLLPGDSVRLSETISADGGGSGAATFADVVAPFLLTATVDIEATEVSTGQTFAYTATTSTTDVPWLALALLLLLLVLILVRVRSRRRRRGAERAAGSAAGATAPAVVPAVVPAAEPGAEDAAAGDARSSRAGPREA